MIAQIPIDARRIIELGPGTGAFTQTMLESGISAEGIDLVELDRSLAAFLSARFRGLRVHCAEPRISAHCFRGLSMRLYQACPFCLSAKLTNGRFLKGLAAS
jgi:16S rRNA A1518/A1519 N6-dimethyltransferase RsmA/KsgA/DIM1 with predicted DNA glycosylase/AP lyase activity